jgi:hypothetical protein
MKVTGYVVLEPGFDRPCISESPPLTYQKKPGSKVYQFELDLPDWNIVDGKLEVKELKPLEDLECSEHCHINIPVIDRPCQREVGHPGSHVHGAYTAGVTIPQQQASRELKALEEEDKGCRAPSPFGGHFRCDLERKHEGKHCHIEELKKYSWD